MKPVSCNVIRDLFPSYVDNLTSEDSNQLIEEHVARCPDCARILNDLRGEALGEILPDDKDKKEIDFLKKNKKRNRRIAIYCIAGAIICLILVFTLRIFLEGMERLSPSNYQVEILSVEDGVLHFKAVGKDGRTFLQKIEVEEHSKMFDRDGRLLIYPQTVLYLPFHPEAKEFAQELSDPDGVKEIWFGMTLLWADGKNISPKTSDVYLTRHLYVGNASMNGKLAGALRARELLGPYENKLETAAEPYGWTFLLQNGMSENERFIKEASMDSIAYVAIALVQNLDHVSFEYTVDGRAMQKTITVKDADEYFGKAVKDCFEHPADLEDLLSKLGLVP